MAEENEINEQDAEFMRNLDDERRARTFYQEDLPQDIIQEISNYTAQDTIHQFANGQISTREFVTKLLSVIRTTDIHLRTIRAQSGIPGLGMMSRVSETGGTLAAMATSNDDIEKLILLKTVVVSMKQPLFDMKASAGQTNKLDPYMDKILKEIYTAISEIAKIEAEK